VSEAATGSDEDQAAWVARLRRRPPRRALDWVASTVAPGARVVAVRALRGGISNAMHVVAVSDGHATCRVVLRRVLSDEIEPGAVAREAAVLEALARHGVGVPGVLAVDPDGSRCGHPALVMTRLHGWRRLPPRAAPAWLESLAAALHALHTVPVADLPPLEDRLDFLARILAGPPPPSYARRPADLPLRALLAQRVGEHASATDLPRVLVHDDFWAGNTLRLGHRVTAVVDWSWPGLGPAGLDVGYCAMDLSLCYGEEARDTFVAAYERLAGAPVEHLAVWELAGALRPADAADWLSGWVDLGLPLTAEAVNRRLTRVKARASAALRAPAPTGRRSPAAAATPR
jgi:aminoglycoside phosphotransferase (APT) family kinase protein